MQRLLDRFQVLTGVKLIPSASIYRRNKSGELIYTDIAEISAVTHHMNIVNYAEGSLLLMLSRKKKDRLEKLRLLNLAEHKLRLAKASSQLGIDTIFQLGNVYYENTKVKLTLQLNDVMVRGKNPKNQKFLNLYCNIRYRTPFAVINKS
jgi:hypothetical protein